MIASKRPATSPDPTFAAIFDERPPFVLRVMRHLGVPETDVQD